MISDINVGFTKAKVVDILLTLLGLPAPDAFADKRSLLRNTLGIKEKYGDNTWVQFVNDYNPKYEDPQEVMG